VASDPDDWGAGGCGEERTGRRAPSFLSPAIQLGTIFGGEPCTSGVDSPLLVTLLVVSVPGRRPLNFVLFKLRGCGLLPPPTSRCTGVMSREGSGTPLLAEVIQGKCGDSGPKPELLPREEAFVLGVGWLGTSPPPPSTCVTVTLVSLHPALWASCAWGIKGRLWLERKKPGHPLECLLLQEIFS
jgi:hypothetical protein